MNQRQETIATLEWSRRNLPPRESEPIKRRQSLANIRTWTEVYPRDEPLGCPIPGACACVPQ